MINKFKKKLSNKNFYLNHPDYNKKYYESHKIHLLKICKKYRDKYKEKLSKYFKEYQIKNRIKINERKKKKYNSNINYKIIIDLRNRLNIALKTQQKSSNTLKLLGCSIEFFKDYLESKFQPGMSWDNYGIDGWHKDHIYPCCSFDLSKKSEQKLCFHWSNYQPMWAIENLKKASKI